MDVDQSQGQPRLLISRQALLQNLALIRRQLVPTTKICAMIKADAYGHDASIVTQTFCEYSWQDSSSQSSADAVQPPLVDQLGVSCFDEAAALPDYRLPILIFRPIENIYLGTNRDALESAIRAGWILTLNTPAVADDIARLAMQLGLRARIHLMLDTGMRRSGCAISSLPELLARIDAHSSLRLTSIGSHFATADVPNDPFVARQTRTFLDATDPLLATRKFQRHLANSGGIFFAAASHFDVVRPGISLYGIDPTCKPNLDRPLRPIAKWTAPIVSILHASAGDTIGYGQTFKTPRDTRIGIIPIGYADGYSRAFGIRATMIVNNIPVPVVGRVSMDLITIDLHDVPGASVGDEVIVMDDDPLSPASVYKLAEISGTIPYEIFTRIGSRVTRVATDEGVKSERLQLTYAG